jgi:cytoskeletal protein CcmA (bactofilin family)
MKKIETVNAFLGKDTEFDGKLIFHGTIRINSHFKGEISGDGILIVGEEGMIEATVHVSYIVTSGEIHGNIIADHRIELHPPGKVFGDIQAPTVVIYEGGIFEGNCRMHPAKEVDEKELLIIEPDSSTGDSATPLGTIHGTATGHPFQSPGSIHDIITAMGNKKTAEPIKDAKVIAKCKGFAKKNTRTDDSGYYELTDLEDGIWKLKVEPKGYEVVEATVEISGGGVYEQNFECS